MPHFAVSFDLGSVVTGLISAAVLLYTRAAHKQVRPPKGNGGATISETIAELAHKVDRTNITVEDHVAQDEIAFRLQSHDTREVKREMRLLRDQFTRLARKVSPGRSGGRRSTDPR